MKVLVAAASKHGSTSEIASTIAYEISSLGLQTELSNMSAPLKVDEYDVAILGSGLYMGRWLSEARHFVNSNREALSSMPVWLFSSGPLGTDDPQPKDDPERITDDLELPHAREHRIFAGSLERSELGVGERLMVRAVRAPEGDFRDWDAIRSWAREIAAHLEDTSLTHGE